MGKTKKWTPESIFIKSDQTLIIWAMRVFGHIVLLLSISLMAITMPAAYAGFATGGSNPSAGGFQLTLDLLGGSGEVNIMESIGFVASSMRLSITFSAYVGRQFLFWFFSLIA